MQTVHSMLFTIEYVLMQCTGFYLLIFLCPHINKLITKPGRYDAGDHVAVYPTNDVSVVNRLGERLGVDLDTVISLKNLDGIY